MFTQPAKTKIHRQLELLSKRKQMNAKENALLYRLNSGYEGELSFKEQLIQNIPQVLALYDLYLKLDGRELQIDCLLIFTNQCVLLEIKNYQNAYIYYDKIWKHHTLEKNIPSPLYQLNRSSILLGNYFSQANIPLTLKHYIVFTHPKFTLYNAPYEQPIILPNQIDTFLSSLKNQPRYLKKYHDELIKKLKSLHIENSRFEEPLEINYDELRKGIYCSKCNTSIRSFNRFSISCDNCNHTESIPSVLKRNITEYHILFPDERITVLSISQWINYLISKHHIRKVLKQNMIHVENGKYTYYLFK